MAYPGTPAGRFVLSYRLVSCLRSHLFAWGFSMLNLWSSRQRTACDGATRRDFLQIGAFGAGCHLHRQTGSQQCGVAHHHRVARLQRRRARRGEPLVVGHNPLLEHESAQEAAYAADDQHGPDEELAEAVAEAMQQVPVIAG